MLSPLLAAEGPPANRALRIARGIGTEVAGFLVLTGLSPLLFGAAAAVDLALWLRRRKPWMGVRILALLWWILFGELRGLIGLLGVWVMCGGPLARDSPARRRRTYRLQVAWAAGHLAGLCRICRVRFEVEGAELVGGGPVIVLARHVSVIDNCIPATLVSRPRGIDLRYVLKDVLQNLPTLDIGGRWVPTCFVRRGSGDRAREIERVRTLAKGLEGKRDGVLIFPEGTRFTRRKLAALRAEANSPEHVARLAGLRHLLPPQTGGPLALLDEAPHAAVVVCGHSGLDDFHDLREIWSGGLVGTRVRVRFWRHERSGLPLERSELIAWLGERWLELDSWIDEQRSGVAPDGAMAER